MKRFCENQIVIKDSDEFVCTENLVDGRALSCPYSSFEDMDKSETRCVGFLRICEPDCYEAEKGTLYPLCIGNGSEKCKECNLYTNMTGPY